VAVRAVLDTQVVVRGLLGIRRSACALVFEALADGAFTAIVSPYILSELSAVLALPKLRTRYGLTDDQAAELLDTYGRLAETISGTLALPEGWRSVGNDPAVPTEDVPIVSAALEGGADYIVSDDAGLLEPKIVAVAGFQRVQVVAPGPFTKQVLHLDGEQAVTSPAKLNAVLDTNVGLAIYSWHELLDAAERISEEDPTATLTNADIQFWAQRTRTAFILALFFNERGWATWSPLNELIRKLVNKAPPVGEEHGRKTNFVRLFIYFIKEKLLPGWLIVGDPSSDESIIGNGVDELCLAGC
jgi:putative PIN family toxin of toxin-antitoxin system